MFMLVDLLQFDFCMMSEQYRPTDITGDIIEQ